MNVININLGKNIKIIDKVELSDRTVFLIESKDGVFIPQNVLCYDLAGKELWRVHLPESDREVKSQRCHFDGLDWYPEWNCICDSEWMRRLAIDVLTGEVRLIKDYFLEILRLEFGNQDKEIWKSLKLSITGMVYSYLQKNSKIFVYGKDTSNNKKYIHVYDESKNLLSSLDLEMSQTIVHMLWSIETNELVIFDSKRDFWVIDQDTGKKLRPFVIKNKIS